MTLAILVLRMSGWARRPPPLWQVLVIFGVIAVGIALYWIERHVGWPAWASVNKPIPFPR